MAWWTGDRLEHRPLWPMRRQHVGSASLTPEDGRPTMFVTAAERTANAFHLGRWQGEGLHWSWAFWVKIERPDPSSPPPDLVLAEVVAPRCQARLSHRGGRLEVTITNRDPNDLNSVVSAPLPAGGIGAGWAHLAFSVEEFWTRLYFNGQPIGEGSAGFPKGVRLGEMAVTASTTGPVPPATGAFFDDVIAFDRELTPREVSALARAGRGHLADILDRPRTARRLWSWGWPLVAGSLALLWVSSLVGWRSGPAFSTLSEALTDRAYRPAWLLLGSGGLATLLASVALAQDARHADAALFDREIHDFTEATDTYFERLADLITRARDWIETQPDLTQARWQRWLASNHAEHDHAGLLGVGYAEQVLPADLAAHEARWSQRHGFPYHVWPEIPDAERLWAPRATGQPRLPVVVYEPHFLDPSVWRTNHSILGQDLLALRYGDPRVSPEPVRIVDALGEGTVMPSGIEEIAPAGWYGEAIRGIRLYAPRVSVSVPDTQLPIEPAGWQGVVFANIDLRRWLTEREDQAPLIGFRIYTGMSERDRHELAVDSGDFLPATRWRPKPSLTREVEIPLYHYRLWVDFWTTPTFDAQSRRHWAWITAAGGSAFSVLAFGLALTQTRAQRRQAAISDQLGKANAELSRVQQARERLSRDLHDGTIQSLYAIGLHLQYAQRHQGDPNGKATVGLEEGQRLVQETIVELREFLLSLQHEPVAGQGFAEIVDGLFVRLRRTTPVEFDLTVDPAALDLPPWAVVQLVNVVREAVSNALRHGQPARVQVSLLATPPPPEGEPPPIVSPDRPRAFHLEIRDDGTGFDSATVEGDGFGLRSLQERAAELGGTLALHSHPGSGTRVRLVFPAPPGPTSPS